MADLGPYYLSFADDSGWLGACLVRGSDDPVGQITETNPVTVAHKQGCNPGGEVMVMPITEDVAGQLPEEFWNTLLTQDDLRSLGSIVDPDNSQLVKGTPEELQDGTAKEIDGG